MHTEDGLEHSSLVGEPTVDPGLQLNSRKLKAFHGAHEPCTLTDRLGMQLQSRLNTSTINSRRQIHTRKDRNVGTCRPIALLEQGRRLL
jgi:hypothetical protein